MLTPTARLADSAGAYRALVPRQPYHSRGISPDTVEYCDGITGGSLAVAGPMRMVVHADAASPAVVDLLGRAGLAVEAELLPYRTAGEYHELLGGLGPGEALVQHAHPVAELPPDRYAVPRHLLVGLADKGRLAEFVPAAHRPRRRVVPTPDLVAEAGGELPVVVKASCDDSLGGGDGVRICRDPDGLRAAAGDFAAAPRVVVEEHLRIAANWCLNFTVDTAGAIGLLGAIEQVVSAGGVHLGSRIGRPAPAEVVRAGRSVVERARDRGYVGVAGTDVAVAADGRLLVLDLNFRVNACTPALMLRDPLAAWSGRPYALSTGFATDLADGDLREVVTRLARARRFVPTSAFLPRAGHRKLAGVVLADRWAEVEDVLASLAAAGLRWSGAVPVSR